jgi:DNA (cytosine-5)-methyltransferase 1
MEKKLKTLDLFSGAGGFSLGLHNAGIITKAAIEFDKFAAETFKNNFPQTDVYNDDVASFTDEDIKKKFQDVDIVVGGPPCQGFSVAGPYKFGMLDSRNNLVLEYLRYISVIEPTICIMENVRNFVNGKLPTNDSAVTVVKDFLDEKGYNVKLHMLYAPNFGVPQSRSRIFIIGVKKNSNLSMPEIIPTHGKGLLPFVTVKDAIGDLPEITQGEGYDFEPCLFSYRHQPINDFQKYSRNHSNGVFNHVAMKHTKRLIERFKYIPQGGSLLSVPAEHGQRLRNGLTLDEKPRFKMNNQRLDPNSISTCITASFQSSFVHPNLNRNLTAREGARLQSFPDHFIFHGPRTLMSKKLLIRENRVEEIGLSQYNQIGNAVPPLLGQAIGTAIMNLFD